MRRVILTLSAVAALAVVSPAAPAPATKQLVVDKDKVQCSKADYTSIQAAVNAASPGDTIKVCPDLYTENVNVTKPLLTLVGPTNVNVGKCSTVTAADPTQDAIVTGAGSYSFSLLNNNVTLSGFVVQGSVDGIDTSASFSGYRITNNLAQNNSASGINFLSNGTNQSRADHNCLRQNNASGLQSEIGNLSNALVDHNATYRNGFAGLDFSGAGARAYVSVTQNSSIEDNGAGFTMDNSIGSSITQNTAQGTPRLDVAGGAVLVGGANNGVDVSGNSLAGGVGNGIRFDQNHFSPVFAAPNVGLSVTGNAVTGFAATGILAATNFPNLTLSVLSNNDVSSNGIAGIRIQAANNNNTVMNNGADKNNSNGIWADGATGNTFTNNHMTLNVGSDARDDNRPANTWTDNHCTTDFPVGTICGG
jgi:parallel beta-helix repeat protein